MGFEGFREGARREAERLHRFDEAKTALKSIFPLGLTALYAHRHPDTAPESSNLWTPQVQDEDAILRLKGSLNLVTGTLDIERVGSLLDVYATFPKISQAEVILFEISQPAVNKKLPRLEEPDLGEIDEESPDFPEAVAEAKATIETVVAKLTAGEIWTPEEKPKTPTRLKDQILEDLEKLA